MPLASSIARPLVSFVGSRLDGSNFLPGDLTNVQAWLDAPDTGTITDTAGDVTAWGDKSGKGNNATTTIGTPRTGDTTENGLNIIDFTADQLSLPSALRSIPNGNNTLIMISMRASEDASLDATIGAATGSTNEYFHTYSNTARTQGFTNVLGGGGTVSTLGAVGVNTAMNISIMNREGTSQSIQVNGGTIATNANAISSATIDNFFIGSSGSGSFLFNGSIGEIIILDKSINTAERALLNNYGSLKWGITLV